MIKNQRVAYQINQELTYKKSYLFKISNPIYRAVETLFKQLKMDAKNISRKNWNPFGDLIKPGDKVVIKPNLVASRDKEKKLMGKVLLATTTNPTVIRPVIDYVWKALKGNGEISIIDAPLEGNNFEETAKDIGLKAMADYLRNEKGVNVKLLDLRSFKMIPVMLLDNLVLGNYSFNFGLLIRKKLKGDPLGYQIVDLKEQSFFSQKGWNFKNLCFHRSNRWEPLKHHSFYKNEYSLAKTVLDADVFINIPKLKTHKKAGVTLSLKNLVGVVNEKYWLPHFRQGIPPKGDEYATSLNISEAILTKLSRINLPGGHSLILNLARIKNKKDMVIDGSWSGNDTLWRTILDLNKILFFADKKGKIQKQTQRRYFSLIDGIIAGEGDGPVRPNPKKCGLLIAGFNPVLVDLFAVRLMGFDYRRIKQIFRGLNLFDITQNKIEKILDIAEDNFHFQPPFTWERIKLKP